MPPRTQRITNEMNKQTQTILAISMSTSKVPDKNWKLLKKPQVNKRWSSQYYFHYEVRKERKLLSYTESLFSFLTNNLASCKVARNIFPFFLISKLIDCGHQTMTRLISKAFLMKRPIDFC